MSEHSVLFHSQVPGHQCKNEYSWSHLLCLITSKLNIFSYSSIAGFPGGASGKGPPANSGDIREAVSVLGSGRCPDGGHDNPLQYSCLENPMDRGAWRATVYRVTKNRTQLKRLSTHAPVYWVIRAKK